MADTTFHSLKLPGQDAARVPSMAEEFTTETNYQVKDYCTYQGKLYRCITAHSAGVWNASHFIETDIDTEFDRKLDIPISQANAPENPRVGDLWIDNDENSPIYNIDTSPVLGSTNAVQSGGTKTALNSLDSRKMEHGVITGDFSASVDYRVGDLVFYATTTNGITTRILYRCTTDHNATAWNASHFTATTLEVELQRVKDSESDTDMIGDLFGSKSIYNIGDYCIYNTNLYKCIQAVNNTGVITPAFDPDDWTQVKLVNEVSNLNSAIGQLDANSIVYQSLTNTGTYIITADDLESGVWNWSRKDDNAARGRTKFLIPVYAGMSISYENTTFDVYFGVLPTPTSMEYYPGLSGWKTDSSGVFNITADGYLTFVIRNHADTSATVDFADYNSIVVIKTSVIQKLNNLSLVNEGIKKNVEQKDNVYIIQAINGYSSGINATITDNSKWLVNKDLLYFDNEFVSITIDDGYSAYLQWVNINGNPVVRELSSGIHYFYGGKNIPVRIVMHRNDSTSILTSEISHLKVKKVLDNTKDIGCGIKEHFIEYDYHAAISFDYLYPYNIVSSDMDLSCPIKIPESGLRIAVNPFYKNGMYLNQSEPHIPTYRIVAVKKSDEGLVLQTDDDGVLAVSESVASSLASVYIPYIEDCYVFIVVNKSDRLYQDHDYSDFLTITSGNVSNNYSGVYGIFPTAVFVDVVDKGDGTEDNQLTIVRRGSYQYINSVSGYYGTVLRLSEAKRIAVSPEYTIMAIIYKINDDNSITRYEDIFGTWSIFSSSSSGYSQVSTSGVSVIDFEKYDFDGFALIAIQCPVIYNRYGTNGYQFLRKSMGGLHGYENVKNSLSVEYKNGIVISTVPGMPAILDENIRKLCNWKVDVYPSGYYTESYDTNSYYFPNMYNCFPSLYQGTYVANTILMNVTAKSALSCLKNPNGRMRKMKRANDGNEGKGRIGYGITCTNFGSIVRGLKENYTNYALVYGNNIKFDRLSFTYPQDLYNLRPGDMLSKHIVPEEDSPSLMGRGVDAHCMTVYSIVVVNGVVKAVNVIEGTPPAPRLSTFLAMDYYLTDDKTKNIVANWYSMAELAKYTAINRIKPEYLKRITDVYDLYPDNTDVGTVMCDRGTESIYGARTHFIELSVSDNMAESLILFKNGSRLASVSLSDATIENGLRIVNVISYINGEGLYTVETNTEPGVTQETFFVKGDVEAMTSTWTADTVTVTIPNVSDLVFLDIWYGTAETFDKMKIRKSLTYVPDDPEQIAINPETNIGTVILPRYIDGVQYNSMSRVYDSPYGTYYASPTGRVSTENYSYDANGDNL